MTTYFEPDVLLRWMKGDKAAADYVELICDILHVWDDLIDKDKEVSSDGINKLFFDVLVTLPRNAFYKKHFEHLNSVLVNSISNWLVATKLEREGGDYEKSIAFILRSSYVDLVTQAAFLLGDQKWACKVGEEVRRFTHGETYEGYVENLSKEKRIREMGNSDEKLAVSGSVSESRNAGLR